MQEARLAKSCLIFWGPDTIDLADFATFLRAFMNDQAADKDIWLTTWLLTDMWRVIAGSSHLPKRAEADGNVKPLAISKALERFDGHKATDFRDRLYALAKVAEWPDGGPSAKPDYRISRLMLLRGVLQRLAGADWAEHRCCKAIDRLGAAIDLHIGEPEMADLIRKTKDSSRNTTADSVIAKSFLYAGEFPRRPAGCRIRSTPDGKLTANILNATKNRELFEWEKAQI